MAGGWETGSAHPCASSTAATAVDTS